MQGDPARTRPLAIGLGLLLVVVLVAGFALLGGEDGEDAPPVTGGGEEREAPVETPSQQPPRPLVPTVVVRGGEPVGGVRRLQYSSGDRVRFRVRADSADEVHVHGYDEFADIPAGGTVVLDFRADIEGIFEVELHGEQEQIAELRIVP